MKVNSRLIQKLSECFKNNRRNFLLLLSYFGPFWKFLQAYRRDNSRKSVTPSNSTTLRLCISRLHAGIQNFLCSRQSNWLELSKEAPNNSIVVLITELFDPYRPAKIGKGFMAPLDASQKQSNLMDQITRSKKEVGKSNLSQKILDLNSSVSSMVEFWVSSNIDFEVITLSIYVIRLPRPPTSAIFRFKPKNCSTWKLENTR